MYLTDAFIKTHKGSQGSNSLHTVIMMCHWWNFCNKCLMIYLAIDVLWNIYKLTEDIAIQCIVEYIASYIEDNNHTK